MKNNQKIKETIESFDKLSLKELIIVQDYLNINFKSRLDSEEGNDLLSELDMDEYGEIMNAESNAHLSTIAQMIANNYTVTNINQVKANVRRKSKTPYSKYGR